jgi:hypothetical protein
VAVEKIKDFCNSCRFFISTHTALGHCHRYPKTLDKPPQSWCGEWQPEEVPVIKNIVVSITEPAPQPKKPRGRPKKC